MNFSLRIEDMNKADLKNGDTLIDFQMGYAREFAVTEEEGNLFLMSDGNKRKIEDNNIQRFHLLITSNDRTE
jgi:hypothetical protein